MSSVPEASSPETARALAIYILGADYTETRLKSLGLTKTPWKESAEQRLLSRKVDASTPLYILIRFFFFGEVILCAEVESTLPNDIVAGMQQTGMISREQDCFAPECMLVHFNNLLIACDSVRRAKAGELSDLVLGVNRPTHILGNCMIHLPQAGSVLDLGTGCGTLALGAASSAKEVIGTDINGRALEFAKFNAAMNGIGNFQVRAGDRFEPIQNKQFDLVISNPPFFLTASSKLLFTDNPFTLDSFVESLARQSPAYLNEGGYFQMLCEWVQLGAQPWQERVRGWFENSGCDVLILTDYEIGPADYTLQRAAESIALHGEASVAELTDHLKYFEDLEVEKIFGGLVTIRRSTVWPDGKPRAKNWFVVEETGGRPASSISNQLLDRFTAEDILSSASETRLLSAKPKLAKDVVLVQESIVESRDWKATRLYIERRSGLIRRLAFNPEIAEVVSTWDGSQDLEFYITAFARKKGVPKKQATQDILGLARKLSSMNLISLKGVN